MSDLFGMAGSRLLDELRLGRADGLRIASLRSLITAYNQEIIALQREVAAALAGDVGYLAIQAIPGVGPALAAVFVAEIGDVGRFASAPQLCSWAGLTPRHRESDTTVRRGPITEQGPRLVRWAAVEATQRLPRGSKQAADFHRIADRRGTGIGRVAAARKLLTLIYYGLRDGHLRCLTRRSGKQCERLGRSPARARVCHDPRPGGVVAHLIEPARLRPYSSMPPGAAKG